MAILSISSTNPAFSYVLCKNPATIHESGKPFQRSLRQGYLYGWFEDGGQTFKLWFKDHPMKSSFTKTHGDVEYLDTTRYASPMVYSSMVNEALRNAAAGMVEDVDTGYSCTVTATVLTPQPRHLSSLSTCPGLTVDALELHSGVHKLTITAPTIQQALNALLCLCLLQALSSQDCDVVLDKAAVSKYLSIMARCNASYLARYTLATKAIHNRDVFKRLKGAIEGPGITMFFGNTRQQRYDALAHAMLRSQAYGNRGNTLVDIGCGELFFSSRLAEHYELCVAYDADADEAARSARFAESRSILAEVLHQEVTPEFVQDSPEVFDGADVLITEVLEHIQEDQSDALLRALLCSGANRLFATVPNSDFNVNYGIPTGEYRHPDHKFEPSFADWADYCHQLAAEYGWSVDVAPIGDVVNDASVSTMTVFFKEIQ